LAQLKSVCHDKDDLDASLNIIFYEKKDKVYILVGSGSSDPTPMIFPREISHSRASCFAIQISPKIFSPFKSHTDETIAFHSVAY
jgi:hypothetical protein